ncbi:MAG TPA: hemophore-related protein [Mycobacterium sp.]|nr:hemophore-related protein [Mycobacterium sp.]
MVRPPLTQLAVIALGIVLSFTGGAVAASADPDLGPVVNTTCSYSQVVSALNAQSPATAAQLNASPSSQMFLRGFLASPPDQRQQTLQEALSKPGAQPYVQQYAGFVLQIANTCNNY